MRSGVVVKDHIDLLGHRRFCRSHSLDRTSLAAATTHKSRCRPSQCVLQHRDQDLALIRVPRSSVGHLRCLQHRHKPESTQHEGDAHSGSNAHPCHYQGHDQWKDHRPRKRGDGHEPAQRRWCFRIRRVQNHSARASLAGLLLSSGVWRSKLSVMLRFCSPSEAVASMAYICWPSRKGT